MVIYNDCKEQNVKFISYSGKYPNLCSGVLILEIDGERVKFGDSHDCDYQRFWSSGGCIYRDDNDDYYAEQDEWEIDARDIPEKYKKYVDDIDKIFNKNVPFGCCGGCI